MKRNFKMKKTILGVSLFLMGSVTLLNSVEAQWSVIDVNSNANKKTLETTQEKLEKGLTSLKNALDGISKNQETQVRQTDQYQEDSDKRNRLAYGMQESIRRDLDAMPTIEQCVEMTNRTGNSAALQASLGGGGGGGGRSTPGSKNYNLSTIKNNSTAQANVLQGVVNSQTCAGGMDAGINGCGTGAMPYAGADVHFSSLKKDYASANQNGIMTNSLNTNAVKAAETYAQNSTLYSAPPEVEIEKVKKNPAYVSVYKPVISKLNAAYEALAEVTALRKAPSALPGGVAGDKWTKDKGDYKSTFGVDAPAIPSFFEVLNFAVMRDYAGPAQAQEIDDPIKLAQQLNEKITISNVIALQQFKATETTNILLAHLLTQAVAPTNIDAVKAEAAKTKNLN